MSSRDWLFRLEDILDALRLVQQYIKDLDFQQFESDQRTKDAVIRNLEIIGEAARHIPNFIVQEYPNIPWRHIRDMRNILIHEYFGIDMDIIWQTLIHDLPFLQSQIEQIKTDNSPRNPSLFKEHDD
ncbi:MAG: DUF86 domain-containing protein [Alphaproteobacteria bacterium]|nr:DUF86 domain-containing protein [Alphaproteobacteria bacterium]